MSEPTDLPLRVRWIAVATLCVVACVPLSIASAQVDCADLPHPIYGIGGSAPNVLLRYTAGALRRISNPITVVYQSPGACSAMGALVNDVPMTGTAKYWGADDVEGSCNLPTGGVQASWGSMATTAPTCSGITALPATVRDTVGPASAFSLIVPRNTTAQQVISSEALYFLYGFGPAGHVAPWTNPATIASRNITSAAGLLVAIAAGLPTTRQLFTNVTTGGWGFDVLTNQAAVNYVAGVGNQAAIDDPNSAIGFTSTETAEAPANIPLVRSLAYQHVGQEQGYYPNSTPDSFDKQNVRDGHYYLWSVHHFYARQTSGGVIENDDTARFINYVTGVAEIPDGENFLDIVISVGNIPDCAFSVTRQGDLGPLASYQPPKSCNGYFEVSTTGETEHDACDGPSDCTDSEFPACNFGYCEVQ